MTHLKEFCADGQQNTRTDEQDPAGQSPNRIIDHTVDRCDDLKKFVHVYLQSEKIRAVQAARPVKKNRIPQKRVSLSFCLRV